MGDVTCPYCGFDEDSFDTCECEPDTMCEHTCTKCNKIFGVVVEYYPSYTESKMPCANGGECDMQKVASYPRVINGMEEYRCEYCYAIEHRDAACKDSCTNRDGGHYKCWDCDKS